MGWTVASLTRLCRRSSQSVGWARLHTDPPLSVCSAGVDLGSEAPVGSNSLAYVSYENPKEGQIQTPLIIQHGLFGRKENFNQLGKQIHHLTRRGVLIPDVRNHGARPRPGALSIKQMSRDLVELTSQLGLNKACMLGHATGGRMAMYTALTMPQLVDRLVVVSSSPLNTQNSLDRWLRYRKACYVLTDLLQNVRSANVENSDTSSSIMDLTAGGVEFQLTANEALKSVLTDGSERALFLSNLGKVNVDTLLDWSAETDTFPQMDDNIFEGPTLFITGESEPVWEGDREVRSIRNLFPNSHFVKIPGASHWVHTEASNDFLAATVSFLQTEF